MPPPMVPAPITPNLSDRQYRSILGHVGDLPDLAFGKEHVALGARLFGRDEVEERLPLELHALVERQVHRDLHRAQRRLPGLEAAEFLRIVAAHLLENLRVAACRLDLLVQIVGLARKQVRVDDLARKAERAFAQLPFLDQCVDHTPLQRLLRRERSAGEDDVERLFDASQARQALRTAGAGNEPELDLGQTEFRRWDRNPVMAHQRYFETAAQRGAVDGGDDRFWAAFQDAL